jgi:hypothetical protein
MKMVNKPVWFKFTNFIVYCGWTMLITFLLIKYGSEFIGIKNHAEFASMIMVTNILLFPIFAKREYAKNKNKTK